MNRAETAVAMALLLATLASLGGIPDSEDAWQRGWQAALRQPPAIDSGTREPLLPWNGEPRTEYDRGYLDGAAFLRDPGSSTRAGTGNDSLWPFRPVQTMAGRQNAAKGGGRT